MTSPDYVRLERMATWARDTLHPYLLELIPQYASATLAMNIQMAAGVVYGRDVYGVNAVSDREPIAADDLEQFAAMCAEAIAHFDTDHLWTPRYSAKKYKSNDQVLIISHHFRANQYSHVWN